MRNKNTLIIRLLLFIRFIYKAKNIIFIKKLNNTMKNIQNKKFVMYITFEKKGVNILQKFIIHNIKKSFFKNLI